jgi:DNA-binding MarR family transcriptional regulator
MSLNDNRPRTPDKPPPQNPEAERMILGAVLLDNKALAGALKHISSGDFFSTTNQKIFRRMVQLAESGNPIDIVTLNDALQASGELRDAQEIAYIAGLPDGLPRVSNVEHHAQIVRRTASLRRLMRACDKVAEDAQEPGANLIALQNRLRELSVSDVPITTIGANGHLAYGLTEFMAAEFPAPQHLINVANEKGEVIAGLIPQNSTAMVFSMPHSLKSFFTTSLALACTTVGIKFGKLAVEKPVRTYLIQMEDFPGQLQWRMRSLMPYMDIEPKNIAILPRCDHKGNKIDVTLPNAQSVAILKREIEDFGADLVIFDVLRRIVNVDLNSPKDSAAFLEQMDSFRYCTSQPTLMLVHHENRKEADIMYASAGSYNLPGWANVMIQFKRKREEDGVSHVEIEVDNKLAQSPEPMRMVLDLKSETPVRLENVEDASGVQELRDALGSDWTVRDLAEALGVHPSNAKRRLKKFMAANLVEKVTAGKRGRTGGLARYKFVGEGD